MKKVLKNFKILIFVVSVNFCIFSGLKVKAMMEKEISSIELVNSGEGCGKDSLKNLQSFEIKSNQNREDLSKMCDGSFVDSNKMEQIPVCFSKFTNEDDEESEEDSDEDEQERNSNKYKWLNPFYDAFDDYFDRFKYVDEEKKFKKLSLHKYASNDMFDGSDKTVIFDDLKIYDGGFFDINFNLLFGYIFQKYKVDFDSLINEKNVEIKFFKNEEDYNNDVVAITKKVLPLRKKINSGKYSNILVYRFNLNLNEIKELLCDNKLYFKIKIGLENSEGSVYGKFIELDYNKLKSSILDSFLVFYSDKKVSEIEDNFNEVKDYLKKIDFKYYEIENFSKKVKELIDSKKVLDYCDFVSEVKSLDYDNREKESYGKLIEYKDKFSKKADILINKIDDKARVEELIIDKKELDDKLEKLIKNDFVTSNDKTGKIKLCFDKLKEFFRKIQKCCIGIKNEFNKGVNGPKKTKGYFYDYLLDLDSPVLFKRKGSEIKCIMDSILELKVHLSKVENKKIGK